MNIDKFYACVVNIKERGRSDFIATIKHDFDYKINENN